MYVILNYFGRMSVWMLITAVIYMIVRKIYFAKSGKKPDMTKEICSMLLAACAVSILSETVFPRIALGFAGGFHIQLNFTSGLVLGYENGDFFRFVSRGVERSINLVPFKTIAQFLFHQEDARFPQEVWNIKRVINLFGNVFLFVPLGFLVPIAIKKADSFGKIFLIGSGYVLFIEITQYFTYRATDVDDYILNMLGIMLGFWLYKIFKKSFINKKLSAN